jgi:hypothetical protein
MLGLVWKSQTAAPSVTSAPGLPPEKRPRWTKTVATGSGQQETSLFSSGAEPIRSAEVVSLVGHRPDPPARERFRRTAKTRAQSVFTEKKDHLSLICIKGSSSFDALLFVIAKSGQGIECPHN